MTATLATDDGRVIDRSWLATLSLCLEKSPRGTRLSRCRHEGPLYVQKPFYPEGCEHAHLYLLHPPGGLVSGDNLQIDIEIKEGAGALVTTPGAARIYRARNEQPLQRQQVRLDVGKNAKVEWFPLETIVYNRACVELDTRINLAAGSHFIGWEINCFGLPASGELFTGGTFQQRYQILQDGKPVFIDRFAITDSNRMALLQGRSGMAGDTVTGFFIVGPHVSSSSCEDLEILMDELRDKANLFQSEQQDNLKFRAAISKVGEFFVGRYLGSSAEQSRKLFTAWWQVLRPVVLGRKACAPRIWST